MFKRIILILLISLLLVFDFGLVFAEPNDGEYSVSVTMLKAYEDVESMGNAAIASAGTLTVTGGDARLRMTLIPIEMMDFLGYLGWITVNGNSVSVLSYYDVVDSYNDPEEGIDASLRGKSYPMVVEFPVDLSTNIQNCTVYVPVMEELGDGKQNARLKIDYPADLFSEASETEEPNKDSTEDANKSEDEVTGIEETQPESTEKEDESDEEELKSEDKASVEEEKGVKEEDKVEEEIDSKSSSSFLEDGFYSLDITLMKYYEDKESMGNDAISPKGYVIVQDGEADLFFESKELKVSNIVASMQSIYYLSGENYVSADKYYLADSDGNFDDNPDIFKVDLENGEQKILDCMVDPHVEPMGDEPLPARLKIDWDGITSVSKSEEEFFSNLESAKKSIDFDSTVKVSRTDKGVSIEAAPGVYEKPFVFYANEIKGKDFEGIKKKFGKGAIVKAYSLRTLGPLAKIPKDHEGLINDLREVYQPGGNVKIAIPVKKDPESYVVYAMHETPKEIPSEVKDGAVVFTYGELIPFALVKEEVAKDGIPHGEEHIGSVSETSEIEVSDNEAVQVREVESQGVITIVLLFLILLIGTSSFFIVKYYKGIKAELEYREELKREIRSRK